MAPRRRPVESQRPYEPGLSRPGARGPTVSDDGSTPAGARSQRTTHLQGSGRRLGVLWHGYLVDSDGMWPEQLGLDTCGECDVEDPGE